MDTHARTYVRTHRRIFSTQALEGNAVFGPVPQEHAHARNRAHRTYPGANGECVCVFFVRTPANQNARASEATAGS